MKRIKQQMCNDVVDAHGDVYNQNKQFSSLANRFCCDDSQSRETNSFSDWHSVSIAILLTNYAFK